MKAWKIGVFIGVARIVVAVAYATAIVGRGFSSRNQPSALEARIARGARNLSIPRNAKYAKNGYFQFLHAHEVGFTLPKLATMI